MRYLPARQPDAASFKIVLPRQAGHEYDVDHYNGQFYITTNKDAKNFRVVTAPIARSVREELDAVHRRTSPSVQDRRAGPSSHDHLVVSEREGGLNYLRVIDMKTQAVAPHRDRRAGLRAVPRRQSRVQHHDRALQLPVDGDAVVGVRLRHEHASSGRC